MKRIIVAAGVCSGLALTASQALAADPFKGCADQMRAMKPHTPDLDQGRRTAFMSCMGLKAPAQAHVVAQVAGAKAAVGAAVPTAAVPVLPIPKAPMRAQDVKRGMTPQSTPTGYKG